MLLPNSLNFVLLGNGVLTIGLILNQNETNKDSVTNRAAPPPSSPLEKITWGCVIVQLIFLLLQTKTTDF
jgi:hypothetical protein